MSIKTLSVKKYGANYKISEHFTLGEFQCRDGSDTVKYSTELLSMLEKLRSYGNFTVSINSGYRTPAYNKKIGGASRSKHTEGLAADIKVWQNGKVVAAKYICCICQDIGFPGVAMIKGGISTHVDARTSGTYRGDETHGYSNNVGGDFYRYFGITKAKINELKAPQEPVKPAEKQEGTEMIYKDIKDVPEWGRDAVYLRVSHGWTDAKNITESMLRAWVIYDRENPYIVDINDVPQWAKDDVQRMIDSGILKGNGVEQIGKRMDQLETLIIIQRGK